MLQVSLHTVCVWSWEGWQVEAISSSRYRDILSLIAVYMLCHFWITPLCFDRRLSMSITNHLLHAFRTSNDLNYKHVLFARYQFDSFFILINNISLARAQDFWDKIKNPTISLLPFPHLFELLNPWKGLIV
jgi:hypothetical protein